MLGYGAIGDDPIGDIGQSAPFTFAPALVGFNAASVGAVVIPMPSFRMTSIAAVSFGTMTLPFVGRALSLQSFSPVTFSTRMVVVRFASSLVRRRVRMTSFRPVTFGSMTL